jgi:hypothetical protein
MGCPDDDLFRLKYTDTLLLTWGSCTDPANPPNPVYVANNNLGYLTELDQVGSENANIGSPTLIAPAVGPYTTRMRPLRNFINLIGHQICYLRQLQFWIYDVVLDNSVYQDPLVIADIDNSRNLNDMYAQSFIKNGLLPNFQPNYFNPAFIIKCGNGSLNVLAGLQETFFSGGNHLGDLSMGLPAPICFDIKKELGKVVDIEVYAQAAQYIDTQQVFQRYYVHCLAEFWTGKSTSGE